VETMVPFIGTHIRTIPHKIFYDRFKEMAVTQEVTYLADEYSKNAVRIIEPSQHDIIDAARTYFVFKELLKKENADALMMDCLPGLKNPHQHVPPCMGFMKLRDEGIPMGCESDLDATLTMMLEQYLFDRPGFQHNPAVDTEKNHYFGAHCTAPTKMLGANQPSEPYILRSHAEAGWGVVPRVLMRAEQDITIAKYLSSKNGEKPQLLLYSGKIVGCPPTPPAGGCRTNIETTINELDDVALVKGHHLCLIYGNFTKEFKTYCQLYDIAVVV
jgi:L-fucose isomerase-like protein